MSGRAVIRKFGHATAWMVAAVLVANAAPAAATTVKRIRSASGDDFTRIVIDVDGSTRYRYGLVPPRTDGHTLARLYLDLDGVRLPPGKRLAAEIRDQRVSAVRTGQHRDSTARIVFELRRPVRTNVFSLSSPPRIVIDLTDQSKPESKQSAPGGPTPQRAESTPPSSPVGRSIARAPTRQRTPEHRSTVTAVTVPHHAETKTPTAGPPQRRLARGVRRVVIDPGHGGKDPGAKGLRGVKESDVVLDISKRVAAKLRKRLGVEVVMTRTGDEFVPLSRRKDLANRFDADLFVSIHANAGRNTKAHGIETYYLKNTNDRATLRLASLENGIVDLIRGRDVSTDADLPYILSDMVQGQKESESIVLANYIQRELVSYLRPRYRSVKNLGVKQGPFLVLDGTYMPSVLVETAFVSNSMEAKRLGSAAYRESIAEGIYLGISHYLKDPKVPGLQ